MEKTIQQQYDLIKEGKGNKDDFLKSARRVFPELITPGNDYNTAVHILKSKSILSEGTSTVTDDKNWFKIFETNLKEAVDVKVGDKLKHKLTKAEFKITNILGNNITGKYTKLGDMEGKVKIGDINKTNKNLIGKTYELLSEAVGVKDTKEYGNQNTFEKIDKDVKAALDHQFDNKDPKNIDNVYGQSFLIGYLAEMDDPKNSKKTVDELKAIVAKNMAKDINYYAKNGMFGVKGIGLETSKVSKPLKGKFKSSGYGDLKENLSTNEGIGMFHDPIGFKKPELSNIDKIFTKEYKGEGMYDIFKSGKKVKSIKGEGNANAWINTEKRKLKENKPGTQNTYRQEINWIKYEVDYIPDNIEVYKRWPEPYKSEALKALEYRKRNFSDMSKDKLDSFKEIKSNPFDLYKNHPKFKEAEQAIAKALKTATKWKDVESTLVNYREVGANDTSSREEIYAIFSKKLNESKLRSVIRNLINEELNEIKSNPFDLYKNHPKFKEAEQAIAKALKTATKWKDVESTLVNYREVGANDTSSREEIYAIFSKKLNESKLRSVIRNLINEELNEIKRIAVSTEIKEIEKTNEALALEAKIKSIDEAIEKRQAKLNLAESEELAEMIDKNMIKTLQKEIKELEKYKAKASKMYEKMIGSTKKEVIDETLNEGNDFGGAGLLVYGRTKRDNDLIDQVLEEEGYYGIFNTHENYWFFPEGEETIDQLENNLENIFIKKGINARFEGQLNENFGRTTYTSLDDAKFEAQRVSDEEGVVQHVEETSEGSGEYRVSDWYDSDLTVASYENGMEL